MHLAGYSEAESRKQKAESRKQKAESRKQKAESRDTYRKIFSQRADKLAFRNHNPLDITHESLAALLLVWLSVFPAPAIAQQKENHKPMKAPSASIDINSATAVDFAKLPGIGPDLAHRIVAYRTKHGPFHRVEDLLVVRGIGPKKWKALRPYLRIERHS